MPINEYGHYGIRWEGTRGEYEFRTLLRLEARYYPQTLSAPNDRWTMSNTRYETVQLLYRRLLDAWNRRDATAFATCFREDGNVIGFDGSPMNGRSEIAATLGGIFQHHQTAGYVAKVRGVRELAPGVVLLRSVAGMAPPGQQVLNPAVNALQTLVAVAHGDEWRIALFQTTPAAFHGRPQLVEQLTQELTEVLHTGQIVV